MEASAEDPRITRSAPPLVPRVSPSCGAGVGRGGRRDLLARLPGAQGRQQGPTVPNGPGPGRRLECALPKRTAACGNPPPFSPPTETAPGVCHGACRGTGFSQSPGKGGPEAPLPRDACNSRPSPSVLLRVGPRRQRIQRTLAVCNAAPSLDHLSISKPTLWFQKKKCFLVFRVPGVGNDRGKIAQRKQAAERGPSRGSSPSGHRVVGRHCHCTKALTSCEP